MSIYVLDGQDATAQRRAALTRAAEAARTGRNVLILSDRGHGIGATDADERLLAELLPKPSDRARLIYLPISDPRGRAPWRLGDVRSASLIGSMTDPLVFVLGSAWVVHERESLDNERTLGRVVSEQRAIAQEFECSTVLVHPFKPGALPDVERLDAGRGGKDDRA